jgi:hypothetical protein
MHSSWNSAASSLRVHHEGVQVVVVEDVVIGHSPVLAVELREQPDQQTAFLQVKVAPGRDDV